jgi:hypothetical protein
METQPKQPEPIDFQFDFYEASIVAIFLMRAAQP